jgi:type IV pilus assembly protein PilE
MLNLNMFKKHHAKTSGFTLIELLIVIAIVAILAALAIPNYQASVRKARRSDAQTDLLEFVGRAERVFTQTNSYATAALPADTTYYNFSFSAAITATTFTITATPAGGQAVDGCGTMNLTHTGLRTHSTALAGCWE